MNKMYLRNWKLKPVAKSTSKIPANITFPQPGINANIPGDIYMHLMDADIIDDPFYADNESGLAWIAECDWEYTTDFNIENTSDIDSLVFDGLDTIADIYLNGNYISQAENMFVRYSFAVGTYLHPGPNSLKVIFRSPLKTTLEKKSDIRQLPSAIYKNRVFIRKAQYAFGWDWGPSFPAMGIWKDVYLKQSQIEINHIEFETLSITGHKADVRVNVIFNNTQKENLAVSIKLFDQDQAFEKSVSTKGKQKISCGLKIENARLWWPHNVGDPHLYNLEVTTRNQKNDKICSYNKKVGIRKVQLKLKENGKNCFRFYINDKALFLKGANWIPADSFLPRITDKKYERLILAARQGNMNVLRVWGGGIYENDIFYELCDREGIVVWQDFMFACATYPDDETFLAIIKEEITQNVQRLQSHPSVIIWCGNNEIEWIWYQHFGGPVENMQGYKFFHNTIPEWLKELDTTRPYWPSSPFGNDEDPNSELSGNRHTWHIWSFWIDYSEVTHDKSLFVTEFGFQAPATFETYKKALPASALSPQSELFEFHNKQVEGSERLFRFLSGHLPVKTELESFIYLTQLNQGLALKTCLDHWRLRWPETAGSIIWQINDCWPVSSWSLIDSEDRRKHSYYFTKHSFQNVLAGITEKLGQVEVTVINDNPYDLTGELYIYSWDFQSNFGQQIKKIRLTVKAFQKKHCLVYSRDELQNKCLIITAVDDKANQLSRNFYTAKKWKHVLLPKADYSKKIVSADKLSLKANTILFFPRVEHPEIETNDLPEVMLAGEECEIDIAFGKLDQQNINELHIKTLNNYLCKM